MPIFELNLAFLDELVAAKKIVPVIDRRYPIEQIVEAHSYVEQKHKKATWSSPSHTTDRVERAMATRARSQGQMKCALCQEEIKNYCTELHKLKLDEHRAVDICDACTRKFVKWQGERLTKLFPTRALKKLHRKSE